MKYTRLYADSDGETHFEDVEVEFEEGQVRPDGVRLGISVPQPNSGHYFIESYSEFFADYHSTPRKQWFIVLSGSGEFGVSDGQVRRFEPGMVFLVDDMASKGHTSWTVEPGNVMIVGLEE